MQQKTGGIWGSWVGGLVPWPRRPDPVVEDIDLGAALRAQGARLDSLDEPSADPADETLSDSIFQMLTEP